MIKKELILIGGGGHCKACIDVIEQEGTYKIAGIVDVAAKINQQIYGYPIIATDGDIPELAKAYRFFLITIGQIKSPRHRIRVYGILKDLGLSLPVVVSPQAYVSKHASIGEGTIVMHQALVNSDASVGCNCIINSKALIEHEAVISDHCHISTGAIINGGARIEEGSFIGSNSTVKEGTSVQSYSVVGFHTKAF